jgi:putative membrane protein
VTDPVTDPGDPERRPAPTRVPAADQGARLADGDWHRVHPLTPAIRSWQLVVFVLLVAVQNVGGDVAQGDLPDFQRPHPGGRLLAGGGAVVLLVVLLVLGVAALSWRMTRFRVTADALELHSGVLYRQQRRARLDRLQAVDIVQPLLARVTGLARLTLEVAGGSGSAVTLSYLTEAQAASLRNHLLARAAGPALRERRGARGARARRRRGAGAAADRRARVLRRHARPSSSGSPPSPRRRSASAGWAWCSARSRSSSASSASSGPGSAAASGSGSRRRRTASGCGTACSSSAPRPCRRAACRRSACGSRCSGAGFDWWSVEVNVAGYGSGGGADSRSPESVLLPVGTRQDAIAVLSLVLPQLTVEPGESPAEVVVSGLAGAGEAHGYLVAPDRAKWVDPLAYRRTGARVTREALLIRRGLLVRQLDVVPHARSQSWGLTQGPVQRRLGLASFQLHSTPGPVTPQVPHLDAGTAAALLADQTERARHARASPGPSGGWRASTGRRRRPRPPGRRARRPRRRARRRRPHRAPRARLQPDQPPAGVAEDRHHGRAVRQRQELPEGRRPRVDRRRQPRPRRRQALVDDDAHVVADRDVVQLVDVLVPEPVAVLGTIATPFRATASGVTPRTDHRSSTSTCRSPLPRVATIVPTSYRRPAIDRSESCRAPRTSFDASGVTVTVTVTRGTGGPPPHAATTAPAATTAATRTTATPTDDPRHPCRPELTRVAGTFQDVAPGVQPWACTGINDERDAGSARPTPCTSQPNPPSEPGSSSSRRVAPSAASAASCLVSRVVVAPAASPAAATASSATCAVTSPSRPAAAAPPGRRGSRSGCRAGVARPAAWE